MSFQAKYSIWVLAMAVICSIASGGQTHRDLAELAESDQQRLELEDYERVAQPEQKVLILTSFLRGLTITEAFWSEFLKRAESLMERSMAMAALARKKSLSEESLAELYRLSDLEFEVLFEVDKVFEASMLRRHSFEPHVPESPRSDWQSLMSQLTREMAARTLLKVGKARAVDIERVFASFGEGDLRSNLPINQVAIGGLEIRLSRSAVLEDLSKALHLNPEQVVALKEVVSSDSSPLSEETIEGLRATLRNAFEEGLCQGWLDDSVSDESESPLASASDKPY